MRGLWHTALLEALIPQRIDPDKITTGVIGLGLMGQSIIVCLLAAGHPVVALTRKLALHRGTRRRISAHLREMQAEGLLGTDPATLLNRLTLSEDVGALSPCAIVIESVIENLAVKRDTYRAVEAVVSRRTIIGSNTSGIPVSILQRDAIHPGRFVGFTGTSRPMSLASWRSSLASKPRELRHNG